MKKRFKGFPIDKKECIRKLIHSQKGDSAALISEALDNLLDDYIINDISLKKREIYVYSDNENVISLSNKCEGFSSQDLDSLIKIGGTTKQDEQQSIGIRGIGILSILNPELVDKFFITFLYKPSETYLQITFNWEEDDLFYEISEVEGNSFSFSCQYTIKFNNSYSYRRVREIIDQRLYFLPSKCYFNNIQVRNHYTYHYTINKDDDKHHVTIKENLRGDVEYLILSKYRHISTCYSTPSFVHGGHNKSDYSLDEYIDGHFHRKSSYYYSEILFPFVKYISVSCNSNSLKLTTSKEKFYLDNEFQALLQFTRNVVFQYLILTFESIDEVSILNNHYIFKKQLEKSIIAEEIAEDDLKALFLSKLVDTKIWRMVNDDKPYSIRELYLKHKGNDTPLFYSIKGDNLNFAYGRFKHDFILTVTNQLISKTDPELINKILSEVFTEENSVNLDTIYNNQDKIDMLLKAGIVSEDTLYPEVKFIKKRELTRKEKAFTKSLERFFNKKEIREIIEMHLFYKIRKIEIRLFDVVNGDTLVLNASFFDPLGNFLLDNRITNFQTDDENQKDNPSTKSIQLTHRKIVLIGLNRCSPELKYIVMSNQEQAIEYSLMYVCSELVSTQKYIAADSQIYYRLRNDLLQDIWDYVIQEGSIHQHAIDVSSKNE